jgi:hypothetical protein
MTDRSEGQHLYVTALCQKLRLTTPMLDKICSDRWGRPYQRLSRLETSSLIDELKEWKAAPAELERMRGQQDLPGFEVTT